MLNIVLIALLSSMIIVTIFILIGWGLLIMDGSKRWGKCIGVTMVVMGLTLLISSMLYMVEKETQQPTPITVERQ